MAVHLHTCLQLSHPLPFPHPGNDCVINPEPFFKLLLTAAGENGTQTVSAHLSPEHCGRWFDPGWLSVIVRDAALGGRERSHPCKEVILMN